MSKIFPGNKVRSPCWNVFGIDRGSEKNCPFLAHFVIFIQVFFRNYVATEQLPGGYDNTHTHGQAKTGGRHYATGWSPSGF